MSSRHGGISRPPFASCNLSYHVGDDPKAVTDNRARLKETLGITRLVSARQVHGAYVATVSSSLDEDTELRDCDALMTDRPGIGLMIQQADCQGVLLHDPLRRVVAAVHAGWRGSVANILAAALRRMSEDYGSRPQDIRALISPSLGPCCAEFINHRQELPPDFTAYQVKPDHFDFWRLSCDQLRQAGVSRHHIEVVGRCTCCDQNFFSYRRARKRGLTDTGRQASVIVLR